MNTAQLIAFYRKEKHLNQVKLSSKLPSVSLGMLMEIESNRRIPTPRQLAEICAALDITIDYFDEESVA